MKNLKNLKNHKRLNKKDQMEIKGGFSPAGMSLTHKGCSHSNPCPPGYECVGPDPYSRCIIAK